MSGAPARAAMIDAAERLVAERGLRNVSLREVQAAAGQRNKSAAQYHFGSLHGLIEAIVVARMTPIDARRVDLLARLDAEGRGDDVRALVEASIDPFAEATLGRPGSRYARFLVQIMADPGMSGLAARDLQAAGLRIVQDRLVAAMTDVPRPLRLGRINRSFVFGIVSLASWEDGPVEAAPARAARVADLVDICVAVLEAPASGRTHDALAALAAVDVLSAATTNPSTTTEPTTDPTTGA
ncbi:MAG TPA: helix-turn-helix domain-containing protein [Acidimicrobiales bacterium]|nr:helix-turn-helix domain-containing protein [Acidimicrobiales bacterium]